MKSFSKLLLAGAAAMLLLGGTASKAAGIPVNQDSGSAGIFQLTNLGGGNFTLQFFGGSSLDLINGNIVGPIPADFDGPLAFSVVQTGNDLKITGGPFTKIFGTSPDWAALTYGLTSGQIGTGNNSNGLILSGGITAVDPNALPGYDFTPLASGGTHTFALTGTAYSGGASSMAGVFATAGASVRGSAAFSEIVPEPASMALMGIGLCGLFTVRRFFKRAVVA